MISRPRLPSEAEDVIRARLILAAVREGEPVSRTEVEFVEGIVEHLARERGRAAAPGGEGADA